MIGQKHNLDYIDNLTNIPHFIVVIGRKGSGKTTLANYIANKLKATISEVGIKVDDIRDTINTAYTVRDKIVYHIKDADTMRSEAKNAMLKITEEPPENAWFILTVIDETTLLNTIKSRATVLRIEEYSVDELKSYMYQTYSEVGSEIDTICGIATTPYEIDKLVEYGSDFIDFVELVIDNITEVESANAFKSSNRLAIKNEDGYDLKLFWDTFVYLCMQRMLNKSDDKFKRYCAFVIITDKYANKVNKLGVNKSQLYDMWVFDIREVY